MCNTNVTNQYLCWNIELNYAKLETEKTLIETLDKICLAWVYK